MITNYLTWYKDLDIKLQGRTDVHLLLSSAVCEPRDILEKHLDEFFHKRISSSLDLSTAWGHPALLNRIADRYGVDIKNVVTTNGVSNAIYLLCRALLSKGAHVVIESPVYEPLVASPDFIGARISYLTRKPSDYMIDFDDLKKVMKYNTELIIISNLHNPSGTLLSDDNLLKLVKEARTISPKIKIAVDEVYHDFTLGKMVPAATLDDCFISLNSLNKVYGLGCVHCGWIIAETAIIDRIKRLQILVEGSGSRLLEGIAAIIIEHLDEYLNRSIRLVKQNRQLLCQYLKPLLDIGVLVGEVPEYGCIYFPKISGMYDPVIFAEKLAEMYNVYVVPGRFFGEPKHIRIGFGSPTSKLKTSLAKFVESTYALI